MSNSDKTSNFIRNIIVRDKQQHHNICTRFPPHPNGYLHIGHAKSICLNFGIAEEYDGRCNLRFDDTNPDKEEVEYIDSIIADVRWLGFNWSGEPLYASDYFQQLYDYALQLIKQGKAYVDSLSNDKIREYRGTLTEAGRESSDRNRSIEENLQLFLGMQAGEFAEGKYVLRAKIDMSSPNINMRDPVIYRIKKTTHHRTEKKWNIYPLYDYAHCISDALEEITHSFCTLEFEDHRPLYDWFLDQLPTPCHPQQIEFSRLNLSYTITSKRKLNELVQNNYVDGWDDPRMPTITGMRRRGYTPASLRDFCERIGVTKHNSLIDMSVLEDCVRENLDKTARRVMGVLRPLRVIIDNYPADQVEELDAPYHPNDPGMGSHKIFFSKIIYIERDDFLVDPPKRFFRLSPGNEVRLRYAYFITCHDFVQDTNTGEIIELHCSYDPETRGGHAPDGRKVKGTIHWVSAQHALEAEIRLYDRLLNQADPENKKHQCDWKTFLNPNSLEILPNARIEQGLAHAKAKEIFQFERQGYFCVDTTSADKPIFNRTVTLRNSWGKLQKN